MGFLCNTIRNDCTSGSLEMIFQSGTKGNVRVMAGLPNYQMDLSEGLLDYCQGPKTRGGALF